MLFDGHSSSDNGLCHIQSIMLFDGHPSFNSSYQELHGICGTKNLGRRNWLDDDLSFLSGGA